MQGEYLAVGLCIEELDKKHLVIVVLTSLHWGLVSLAALVVVGYRHSLLYRVVYLRT